MSKQSTPPKRIGQPRSIVVATLFIQPTGQSLAPLEATASDKFKIDPPGIIFEFDAAKKQMTIKRGGGERVFTRGKIVVIIG